MRNKIYYAVIIYGMSILFVLLQSMLDLSNVFVIFLILPVPYFLAIYMYLGIKDVNAEYNEELVSWNEDNKILSQQVERQSQMDTSRRLIIDSKQEEIDELKRELSSVAKKEKIAKQLRDTMKLGASPFNQDYDNTEELHICECGSEMRECKTMYICKNLMCKKRVKKATLSATEVMK